MHYVLNLHGSLSGVNFLTARGPFPSVEQARIAASNSALYRHSVVVTGNRAEVVDLHVEPPELPPADRARHPESIAA